MSLATSDFIFSNEPRHRIRRHVIFWLCYILFSVLLYGSKPFVMPENLTQWGFRLYVYRMALLDSLLFVMPQILLAYTFIYLLIPRFLLRGNYLLFGAGMVFSVLVMAAISSLISMHIIGDYRSLPIGYSFYYGLMGGLRGGLTITGFAGAIKLAKYWYIKERQNQWLESEKLKAELQILKAQVHPHFLFNTLNNLYSLTLNESKQAPEVVLKLSGLLRFMLYECNVPTVPLALEVKFIRDYIELERLRYGDRLDLSLHIKGNTAHRSIAPLLLIPFLENSFKHGASEQLDQAWINIDLSVKGRKLKFKVINAINPAVPATQEKHGIGLQNVQKRLQLLYPGRHDLRIRQENEMFMIALTLELEECAIPVATEKTAPDTTALQPATA